MVEHQLKEDNKSDGTKFRWKEKKNYTDIYGIGTNAGDEYHDGYEIFVAFYSRFFIIPIFFIYTVILSTIVYVSIEKLRTLANVLLV